MDMPLVSNNGKDGSCGKLMAVPAAQTSIIQNLSYFEHLSEPMAEFLQILSEQYDYPQLAEEILR